MASEGLIHKELLTGRGSARLERLVRDQEVGSSNLPAPTIKNGNVDVPVFIFGAWMFWVYILQSQKTRRYYTGSTERLSERVKEHNAGECKFTRTGIPWNLVYAKECVTRTDAASEEKRIKSWGARRFLESLTG